MLRLPLSNLYLSSVGAIFTIAFISYYVQYPALSSQSAGIEPCERIFRQVFPRLYENAIVSGYFDVDSFVELMNLVGIVVSTVIASGIAQHGSLFILVSAIYRLLYTLGGSFYTFQWDILLLETGYLTALCFAPWQSLRLENVIGAGVWPLRFLLFKLMFMSGVVKIQAECPTWQNLTALEFHFATQCLPGPLAWHAHQLHPLLLRLGVAATFVIEIPAAFLLIFPLKTVRKVGAWLQILLQVLIIATGNYNFFNLLTIALCFTCMMGEESNKALDQRQRQWKSELAASMVFLAWSCTQMFQVYHEQHPIQSGRQVMGVRLALSTHDCNLMIQKIVPACAVFVLTITIFNGVQWVAKETSFHRRLTSLIHVLVCSFCVIATAVPLYGLNPSMKQPILFEKTLQGIPHNNFLTSSGYGLFRRMTGVGRVAIQNGDESFGWAGLSPSVVARPEIIIEALLEDTHDSNINLASDAEERGVWHELNFRWKPGDTTTWPRQVAPHQPRFDWRMWFAALGSYQYNPWLLSFVDKLLNACPVVVDLLDEPGILSGNKRILKVRANTYYYDFTRLDTEWARGIPDATILPNQSLWQRPEQVWSRKLGQQYLPPIEKGNPSLQQFLRLNGFQSPVCVHLKDRCASLSSSAKLACRIAVLARRWNRPCLMSVFAFALCLRHVFAVSPKLRSKSSNVRKGKTD
ncbi:hypothetical protein HJC23_002327 [Cyclotella cryptica]|uniref:Lipase maturation factor 2 n=1 Tax=Cyclotella cryptica TaxID=29204 RepID=A0ABD3QLE2_9STRA|eukprot:CCRYP_004428-RA/>CCRYP_004428-RA protein AED:0.07 eAED:0.07 QI:288/1/1/1/1/1/2/1970/691